ncbi:MAG: hypothetical protein AABY49_13875 [Planctomycetota bacterium]
MSKHEKSGDKHEKGNNRNLVGQDGPGKTSENEVFKNLDDGRRGFLKKLLISATYVTPAILTLSLRELEAKIPTKNEKKKK